MVIILMNERSNHNHTLLFRQNMITVPGSVRKAAHNLKGTDGCQYNKRSYQFLQNISTNNILYLCSLKRKSVSVEQFGEIHNIQFPNILAPKEKAMNWMSQGRQEINAMLTKYTVQYYITFTTINYIS